MPKFRTSLGNLFWLFTFILLSFSFLASPNRAYANTNTLFAIKDASVEKQQPNTNFNDNELRASPISSPYGAKSYIKFDLSSFQSLDTINSAKLRLRLANTFDSLSGKFTVYPLINNWSETGVTYDQSPSYFTAPKAQITVTRGSSYNEWDVTDFVKNWVNDPGTHANHGFILMANDLRFHFYSREKGNGFWPELYVDFTPFKIVVPRIIIATNTPTPTSTPSPTPTLTPTLTPTPTPTKDLAPSITTTTSSQQITRTPTLESSADQKTSPPPNEENDNKAGPSVTEPVKASTFQINFMYAISALVVLLLIIIIALLLYISRQKNGIALKTELTGEQPENLKKV